MIICSKHCNLLLVGGFSQILAGVTCCVVEFLARRAAFKLTRGLANALAALYRLQVDACGYKARIS
jgi:hypothetical protein